MYHFLSCSACKRHFIASYFIVICGLSVSTIFFLHYLIKYAILGENNIEWKYVLILSTIFVCYISHFQKISARYQKCTQVFNYPLFLSYFNPLNPELNPICYLLALLGAHHFFHVSRIRVKSLTFRRLMSYIYIWSTHSWCF